MDTTKKTLRRLAIGGIAGLAMLASVPLALADDVLVVADAAGDTVDDSDATPLSVPQADILTSSIAIRPEGLVLQVKVQKPTAPLSDAGWDGASSIDWDLDTTGDGTADFAADYFVDSDTGQLTGDVYRPTDEEDHGSLCGVKATTFSAEFGYSAVLDPACLGSPATIAYQVSFFYDTNPDDDEAPVGADYAPDVALSAPIALAKAPAPASAPATSAPPPAAPPPAAPPPAPTPVEVTPVSPTPASPVAAPVTPPAAVPARPRANPGPLPRTPPEVLTSPESGVVPVLAATGASQAGELATLGGALVLLGAGSLVLRGRMVRRASGNVA